jgi:hypothetical protein
MASFEKDLSEATFAAFSIPADLDGEDIEVIIERSIEVMDSQGNSRFVDALVHVKKDGMPAWDSGDTIESGDGDFILNQVISDDGYIQKIAASPV